MNLTAEQKRELTKFPEALRALVEAELAAGNSIVEVGHSHPAPPVGAYFKLARKVTTHTRADGSGLRFYERNSSLYSGEFTDATRFFFVLEPANPPPAYPDMDAIRQAHEPKPTSLTHFAPIPQARSQPATRRKDVQENRAEPATAPTDALVLTETDNSATRLLHFQDRRPPHEIQFELESNLMTLFTVAMVDGRLTMMASSKVVGAQYDFELRFEAAMLLKNCYSLRVETSWAKSAATHHDYYRKTADSWFSHWTRSFTPANPPAADAGSSVRYEKICAASLNAEAHLDTVPAIQQTILAEMKRGARFTTSHKEGGSNIYWRNGSFAKTDYGDYPDHQNFASDEEFLKFLRQYYNSETSQNAHPKKVSEFVAWKLILRLLRK